MSAEMASSAAAVRPSSEERIMAALSHLAALASGLGLVLPVYAWQSGRGRSDYARFQALQAYGYQSLGYTLWLLLMLVLVVLVVLPVAMFPLVFLSEGSPVQDAEAGEAIVLGAIITQGVVLMVIFLAMFLYFLPPLVGALACALGRDFRYPLLGTRLARYLGHPGAWIEAHEDRWLAAMGHLLVILPLWGLIGPAAVWLLARPRSDLLGRQTLQTLVYQVFVNLLIVGGTPLFLVLILAVSLGIFALPSEAGVVAVGIAVMLLGLAGLFLMYLLLPLLHLLGQWLGYRLLRGHDPRYPLLGALSDRWHARLAKN